MEQRVKTLEQEVKILKNQIQKTLLDIQEQVLLRYHPALRPEESLGNGNGVATGDNKLPSVMDFQDTPIARPTSSLVRQISLADLRATPAEATPPVPAPSVGGQDTFAALATWVAESVGQIGGERTRKILALRAAATAIPPQIHNTLNELIILYSEDEEMRQGAAADMLQQLNHLLDTRPGHTG